ncbi:MAG: K(+)-transporting ATPase subunit C [Synechococcales cyanobacterium RU_4_20]|nr:K(+)-transporting ATPase subunit C [Synechococcales cyanobacterium RU_4_20]NJR70844.1 K(+)-transporting ATPase subunit C [Synechococcales cyanobacterium CRU_2_2]
MSIVKDFVRSIRLVLVLWLLTTVLYPFITFAIGQAVFPSQANGSLLQNAQGQIVGSALIGQPFTSDRYFWSRPSTINYATQLEVATTGISGASNFAPSNPALLDRIKFEVQRLEQTQTKATADLLYTSGSGLDPHISLAAAQAQIQRVAQSRGKAISELQTLVEQSTDQRFLNIFGEPGVNVLKLNLALDQV